MMGALPQTLPLQRPAFMPPMHNRAFRQPLLQHDRARVLARRPALVRRQQQHRCQQIMTAAVVEQSKEMHTGGYDLEGQERERALVQKFRLADKDGNGVIDREELAALLSAFEDGAVEPEEQWLTDEEVDKIMSVYDTERTGTLQFSQFKQLAKDGVLLHGTVQQYSAAFDRVDSDHDGLITADELSTMFGSIGGNMPDEQRIKAEFEDYDLEHKGKIGFYEFLRMFRRHLLDLQAVIDYLHKPVPSESQDGTMGPALVAPGEVREIESEEELDALMSSDDRLTVLLAGFTWCRPCRALLTPYGKLAERYSDKAKFIKFYGNANENTKSLFRDRLKARATPTLCFFNSKGLGVPGRLLWANAGEVTHTHTGGNKAKLEYYLREAVGDNGETVYPPYQLTEKELADKAQASIDDED